MTVTIKGTELLLASGTRVRQCTSMSSLAAILTRPETMRSEASSRRLLYGSLLGIGFLLRLGFMLWHKLYVFHPAAIFEVSSIAAHIARGPGFSSPFAADTGPTAWIAPAYPYFVAAVFKIFGIYSATSMAVVLAVHLLMAGASWPGCRCQRRSLRQ